MRRRPARWLLVAAIPLVAACGAGHAEEAPPTSTTSPAHFPSLIEQPSKKTSVTVQSVVDVRTVRLSDGTEFKINGLAAPDDCWAEAATTFARTMLLDKPVEPTASGSLRLADSTDYAVVAVELGMTRNESADDRALKEAEATAAAKRLGRWGPPCVKPSTSTAPPPAPGTTSTTTPKPKPVPGCAVNYHVTDVWPGGFRTDVTIYNTGNTEVNGWTLQWKFASGQRINEMWNATPKQSGADVQATAVSYNQVIPAGESLLMGFTGSSGNTNADPRSFSLNGLACTLRA
ncbi:cellulose-binding domain-containing protein [Lentzea sp. NPDC004782]|uniref:cellulose-binding domain-containing protein n=1 Tax=Lentzea sp. NPDC004782 TaxID=3154458 RepID=UPI0033B7507A